MKDRIALKLGHLALDVPFFQASLSGYSSYAMRALARRFGCPLTLTGVMLAKSMANPRVLRGPQFRPGDDEHPIGAQILGRAPKTMAKAAVDLKAVGYDLIDLNFACPAPKVLRRGRGGALLNEPDTVIDILKAVREAVDGPVLMKLRAGVNHKSGSQTSFWEIVSRSIECGVDALVIHGRTVTQRYRGKADWNLVANVKRQFPTATILGSGDIFDAQAAMDRLKDTGLDGVVLARGAVGNPWIFRDLRCLWENRPLTPAPTLGEQGQVMLDHFHGILDGYQEKRAVGYFRKFLVRYAKRHPHRKQVLMDLMQAKTRSEVEQGIERYYCQPSDGSP